jgi:hypothetical protein
MPAFRSAQTVSVPKVGEQVATTTTTQLAVRPFVCVSRTEEETFYQPLRVAGALLLGPALLYAATKLPDDQGAAKLLTAASGIWMVVYNSLRHYEIDAEMERYDLSQGNV